MADTCVQGNEASIFINGGDLLRELSDYKLLKYYRALKCYRCP
jgi:hypothetical protein